MADGVCCVAVCGEGDGVGVVGRSRPSSGLNCRAGRRRRLVVEEPVPLGRAAWRLLLASVFSSANKEWVEQLGAGGGVFSVHSDSSDDLDIFVDAPQEHPVLMH